MKMLPLSIKLLFIPAALIVLYFVVEAVLFLLYFSYGSTDVLYVKRDFRHQKVTAIVTPVRLLAPIVGLTVTDLKSRLEAEGFECLTDSGLLKCAASEPNSLCADTYTIVAELSALDKVTAYKAEKTSDCS